ncbi:MAG: hypothetical protein IJX80_00030 [Clostridia bacterium]|nr:hypothetical protein [Clostridia bacterium]
MNYRIFIDSQSGVSYAEKQFSATVGTATICKESNSVGYALYLDATCPEGFGTDSAVRIRPTDLPATGIRFMANEQYSPWWCRPTWGDDFTALPDRVYEILWQDGDHWRVLLPLCADTFKAVLRGCENGLELVVTANCAGITDCTNQPVLLYGEGDEPLKLLHNVAAEASRILHCPLRAERECHDLFNWLGWCSWDAFQIRVTHKKLLQKAAEFKEKGIPVHYAIIDDMWADVPHLAELPPDIEFGPQVCEMHASPLRDFEGDPVRFPKGMRAAVEDLKAAGIPKVGIWFPTTGYWYGLIPDSPIHNALRDVTMMGSEGRIVVKPDPTSAKAFYDTLCARAKSWGADMVKIDNQGFYNNHKNIAPIGQAASAAQSAIDAAANAHFDGALINCMGMPSECMYHRPTSAVCRCSGDFMPENRAWFSRHILQTAYNGLLQGEFYVNDWDMWWTDDGQAYKNSLCRAISGGPIYVSDTLGRSRPEVLRPVMFSDGRIARCDRSAIPTADCLMENPTASGKIFKIQNAYKSAGLIAAFNIDEENRSTAGTVSPTDAGLPNGRYAYYEHFSGACGILEAGECISLTLADNDEFRLYTFLPYDGSPVCFGNAEMFIGVGAITKEENGALSLYEGGRITFLSESPITVEGATAQETNGLLTIATVPLEFRKIVIK